jgi:uncharacterized membrane protein YkoI
MLIKLKFIVLAIFLSWGLTNSVNAQLSTASPAAEMNPSKKTKKYQCRLISRAEAIKQAKRKTKGKVVGVQLSERGSRSIYKVRMLVEQKRVKTISINACK